MSAPMKYQLALSFHADDMLRIQAIAKTERRRPADVIRNILEDVHAGRLDVPRPNKERSVRHHLSVRIDTGLKDKVEELKESTRMAPERIVHLALQSMGSMPPPITLEDVTWS